MILPLATTALPKPLRRRLIRDTQTLTRALGGVRDLDAQQELLTASETAATKAEQRGLAFAHRILQRRRKQALKAARREPATRDWLLCAQKAQGVLVTVVEPEVAPTSTEVHEAAQSALEFETLIRDPKNILELHALRIAVKRLRFTLSRVPETEKSLKKTVAGLQTILGTIHDLDILRAWLRELIVEKKRRLRPNRRERASLIVLRRRFQTERTTAYLAFREQWEVALPSLQEL